MDNYHDQQFEYNIRELLIRVGSDENPSCTSTNENLNCIAINSSMNIDANFSQRIENKSHYTNLDDSNINTQPILTYQSSSANVQNNECSIYNLVVNHWGLETIYSILTENDIDITAVKYMDKGHLEKLLSSCAMGIEIKFERYLMEWQKEQNLYRKLSDHSFKKLFKDLQQQRNTTIDTKNCIAFHLLHGLLRPTTIKCRIVNNKKEWIKFTISDSQNSLMVFEKTAQECKIIIECKKSTATTEKNTVQPFVFVLGANEFAPANFYVYMDGIKYKLPSVVSAIDCAFKIFQVFNIKYPEESVAVWLFIQKYLYNVKTVYDPVFPSVDLFISRLKK